MGRISQKGENAIKYVNLGLIDQNGAKSASMGFIRGKGDMPSKSGLHKSKRGKMPSNSAYLGFISEKWGKCHQNMPELAPFVKRGQNAIKICLNGPH